MSLHRAAPRLRWSLAAVTLLTLSLALAHAAYAAPTLGFRESWPGTSTQGWGGGVLQGMVYTNPGTGGAAGDGYLHMSNGARNHFGARSFGLEYVGDWIAAGITQVRLSLNDVGADQPLEVHFAIGNPNNVWQYNTGFLPPLNAWAEFVVNLADSNQFTHTIAIDGFGYLFALTNVLVVHVRHDLAPYMQVPDSISADLGLDELLLTNGIVGVDAPPRGGTRPVMLAPPYPNPSRGPVALAVESFAPGPVQLQVVDLQGRVVRRAELAEGAAGMRIWTWDGADDHGRPVAAGSYRVRAFSAAGGTSRPLVRIN